MQLMGNFGSDKRELTKQGPDWFVNLYMGNACLGPVLNGKGFLETGLHAVRRTRPPEDSLPPPSKSQPTTSTTAPASPVHIQSTPPEPVKITPDESTNKPPETPNPKKPTHRKRSSLGLQIDSVLGRKTDNLKEMYSLWRKLGQGQFRTTCLCLENGTGKEFACKSIAKGKLTTGEDVRREILILYQ